MIRDPMAEPCGLWRSPGPGVKPLGSQPSVLFQVGVKLKGWFTQEQDVYFSAIIHTYLKNLTSTSWKCGCQDNSSTWQTRKCHPSNPTQHGMVASANGRPRLVLTGFHTTAMFLLHLLVPWQLVCEDSFDNGTLIEGLISNTRAFSMGVLALSFNVEWFCWQPLWLKPERCQQSIKNNAAKSRSCNHDCPCDGYLRQNVSWGTKYSSFFSKFRVFVCHLRKHPKDGDPLCKLCLRDTKTCPRIALLKIVVKKKHPTTQSIPPIIATEPNCQLLNSSNGISGSVQLYKYLPNPDQGSGI